jgi:bacterial/archaeal transporter family protein
MKLQLALSTLAIVVMWGFWAFLQKIGTKQLGWQAALFWACIGTVIVDVGIAAFLVKQGVNMKPGRPGVACMVNAAFLASAALIIWVYGLRDANVGVFAAMTALYPAVTAVLGMIFLGDRISLTSAAGIVLAVAAGFLLSLGS